MNPCVPLPAAITTELLLQVFDAPVSFHRCLIPLTGSVTAALLLSQALTTTLELAPEQDGWFLMSREAWTAHTGLSRWELETARRVLRAAGFLEERRAGLPARLYYRVCTLPIWHALYDRARHLTSAAEGLAVPGSAA